MRISFVLALLLAAATSAWAADAKIAGAAVNPNNRSQIFVYLDNPAPLPADAAGWQWIVFEKTASGKTTSVNRIDVTGADSSGLAAGPAEKKVVVALSRPVAGATTIKQIQILLVTTTDFTQIPALTKPTELGIGTGPPPGVFAAAKGKSDADVYFSGSYTAILDGAPVYDIDAFAGYMLPLSANSDAGKIGLYGQVRTKMSQVADPNSFLTYLVYQNVIGNGGWLGPFQAPIFNYRFFGSEFDRTATELTLITSPEITVPFRPFKPPANVSSKISWPQFNLLMGAEFVDVRKSVLAPVGWHTRGLLGATFSSGYAPKQNFFDSVQLSSSWQLRLPSAPEIYYDPRFAPIDPTTGQKNLKKIPAMLGTQPRHYLDTKLTFNYAVWGGITFEHTYGSLPPAFNKTDQTFALGLTFTLQQASYGRTAILRPQ